MIRIILVLLIIELSVHNVSNLSLVPWRCDLRAEL